MELADIEKLTELARIDITDEEKDEILRNMQDILQFVGEISEAATEEKAIGVSEHRNIMREDDCAHKSGAYAEDLIGSASMTKDEYIKVKSIL